MNLYRVLLCLIPALMCLIGCGGSDGPAVYPVTGKVTFSGGSLAGYRISFVSADRQSGAVGTIKDDGTYTLQVSDGRAGCTTGKFKVVIQPIVDLNSMQEKMKKMENMKPGTKAMPVPESKLPKTINDAATSTKEVEVKSESNTIDISI